MGMQGENEIHFRLHSLGKICIFFLIWVCYGTVLFLFQEYVMKGEILLMLLYISFLLKYRDKFLVQTNV